CARGPNIWTGPLDSW
nr:immunoglobulin heavy chain junction region [Macaca mulatta]MOV39772.1 immunoglobulin heavy chain junction region [Macaca mulatta]MOV43903.1 immunoglobulin heavy chain junction region [Macaca mulatta]MOV44543.1 immunoglobulin heavy chain junction region [Macaca mulatta]